MRYHSMTINLLIMWDYQSKSGEAHRKKHLDSMLRLRLMTIRSRIISILLDTKPQNVPTDGIWLTTSDKVSMVAILTDLQTIVRDIFNMPTQTIPMLSKKPKKATNDLHKDILGTRNPGLGYMAKRAQPVLYDADTLLHPNHHPVSIWDSEEVPLKGSCDQQALESDRIQLQDTITSLRIQLDALSALTTQHTKLQAQVTGTTSSGPSTSETPKVLAPGMYNLGSKYIPPPKRANWVKPTPLPKKRQTKRFKRQPKKDMENIKESLENTISKLLLIARLSGSPLVVQNCSLVSGFWLPQGPNRWHLVIINLGDNHHSLRDLYVEGLKHKLILRGQFCDGGFELHSDSIHVNPQLSYVDSTQGSRNPTVLIALNDMIFDGLRFLRSKDETLKSIEKFYCEDQRALNATVSIRQNR
ncbi:hypothetical protein Tco_0339111 [Tanacetum coccineum]